MLYEDNDLIIMTDIIPRTWRVVEYNLVKTLQYIFSVDKEELNGNKFIVKEIEELNENIGS